MISLQPLQRADLGLLAAWLAEPLVARWWAEDPAQVAARYGPALDGADPTALYLVLEDGAPVGFVQVYCFADEPAYAAELAHLLAVPDGALSIDYLVGEPAARGRGVGTALVRAAVDRGFADHADAADVVVPVHADNRASWRALERAGFVRVAEGELEPDNPADDRRHVVLRRGRTP
ncbi:GNAT family N-acetyltransferase [Klenkia brasiliensis]|uniref:Aminoglycoside 6'-N-acetyltransferase n=1 Tax=Klenkia brasiliensis TaxID=333142 RepID=A0A1G7WR88_9ACTN|nr:GNAT family N-acetyltransferase [Klenkia brasiliensis]SDG73750.1 aminoglycoside 6'-N-acetyltransferase [Klenkia brasiliensis]